MSSRVEIIPIKPHSDGDPSHKPPPEWKLANPPTIYLEKIATLWMQERGELKPGIKYYLDKLPDGYTLYERGRPSNAKIVDKHLYGHPRQKFFDSPNRFFPHFSYLMTNGNSQGCTCTLCGAKASAAPLPIGRAQAKKSVQILKPIPQPAKKVVVDEEFTPDVIRQCIDKLKIMGTLDTAIEEKLSMDWRAEREALPNTLSTLAKQKSWLPRVGELVLFIRDGAGVEIFLDEKSQEYRLLQGEKVTSPQWEAGVVGQVPVEVIKLDDIVIDTTKNQGVNYSGYRVEPLPNSNSEDKSLSRKYKYVPLHHIRPFVFWKEFLRGIPDKERHPTIQNALTVMGSMALMDRFHFKGTWPTATIFNHGIYIGSELITVGDTVRIMPKNGNVRDVLQVESIRLLLSNLDKASDDDDDEGHPYNTTIHVCGKAFTLDESRAWTLTPVSRAHPGMEGYDDWYWLHDPKRAYRLAFSSIIGRCFEANPMLLWFPNTGDDNDTSGSSLNRGLLGIREARAYSCANDKRILPGKYWFWGDSRAETLDIQSINNIDVSYYDEERDDEKLDEWHKAAKVLERTATTSEQAALAHKLIGDTRPAARIAAEDGHGGALRAAAAVTVGIDTPTTDTPKEEESDDSVVAISVRRFSASNHTQSERPSPVKKRSFSTMASSRDELDHDPGDTAPYSLEEWIKPVAMQQPSTRTVATTRPSAPKPTPGAHNAQATPKPKSSPTTPSQPQSNTPKPKQTVVTASHPLHQEMEAAYSEEKSSPSQSPSAVLAAFQSRDTPRAALTTASSKRPRVVVCIDD